MAERTPKPNAVRKADVKVDSTNCPPAVVFELVEVYNRGLPASDGWYVDARGNRVEWTNPNVVAYRRYFTEDELHSLCGEDAPEQCQEFEDESGRWHRV